jgi:hypothetical protein
MQAKYLPTESFLESFTDVQSGPVEEKCCRCRQILILNGAVDGRNTMKVANILTENQGQSFINSPILCVLLFGIGTLKLSFLIFSRYHSLYL